MPIKNWILNLIVYRRLYATLGGDELSHLYQILKAIPLSRPPNRRFRYCVTLWRFTLLWYITGFWRLTYHLLYQCYSIGHVSMPKRCLMGQCWWLIYLNEHCVALAWAIFLHARLWILMVVFQMLIQDEVTIPIPICAGRHNIGIHLATMGQLAMFPSLCVYSETSNNYQQIQ